MTGFADGKTNWPPRPGLQGDYRDTCIVCLRATDTAMAFRGEAEFLAAGLICLGVPHDDAMRIASQASGDNADNLTMRIQVCALCVAKSKPSFPAPRVHMKGSNIPLVAQKPQLLGDGVSLPGTG
jgi:hypothetical protein